MNQIRLDKISSLLDRCSTCDMCPDIVIALKNGTCFLHDLGTFDIIRVINIFIERVALQNLKLQNHNWRGLEEVIVHLANEKEKQIKKIEIVTSDTSYELILSINFKRLIGCFQNVSKNIDKDLERQKHLQSIGHPNKNIFIVSKGIIIDDLFKTTLLL